MEIVQSGGWLMVPILLCSVIAAAISVERLWTLQRSRIVPKNLLAQICVETYVVQEMFGGGRSLDVEQCRNAQSEHRLRRMPYRARKGAVVSCGA